MSTFCKAPVHSFSSYVVSMCCAPTLKRVIAQMLSKHDPVSKPHHMLGPPHKNSVPTWPISTKDSLSQPGQFWWLPYRAILGGSMISTDAPSPPPSLFSFTLRHFLSFNRHWASHLPCHLYPLGHHHDCIHTITIYWNHHHSKLNFIFYREFSNVLLWHTLQVLVQKGFMTSEASVYMRVIKVYYCKAVHCIA